MGEGEGSEERGVKKGGGEGLSVLCGSFFWRTDGRTKCNKESREKPHFVRFDNCV